MTSQNKKFFIIVADDDIDDQQLIKQALGETGLNCEVTSLNNGLQLMDYLLKNIASGKSPEASPDLILLDINMPLLNGFGVLKQMAEYGLFSHVPVYMLSTSNSRADMNRSYEMGAKGYYVKPIGYQQLRDILREICERELELKLA